MTQGRIRQKNVYLDYNATAPIFPELMRQVPTWLEEWGNASSIHQHGRGAKKLVREARQSFAKFIGAHPLEVIFTSGGSEANNLALKSFLHFKDTDRMEVISTRIEHPSVLKTLEYLEQEGLKVHYVNVDIHGHIDIAHYKSLLSEKTSLVSFMIANNELGTVFPLKELAILAKKAGAFVHSDAVQALGRIPFNVQDIPVDLVSFSGHKFYGLKGSGILYCRKGSSVESLIHGGGQERGRRAGTENVLAIASMGYMVPYLEKQPEFYDQMQRLRDHMESRILDEIVKVRILASESPRLPNTSCMLISGAHGESLLMSLDMKGFSVSTGAACSSGSPEPSHVLFAIGLTHEEAQSSLRISLGWLSTKEEVDRFVDTLKSVVEHLRNVNEVENDRTV